MSAHVLIRGSMTDLPAAEPPKSGKRRNQVMLTDLAIEDVLMALIDSGFLDSEEHGMFTSALRRLQDGKDIYATTKARARKRFEAIGLDADKVASAQWQGSRVVAAGFAWNEGAMGPKALKPPGRR